MCLSKTFVDDDLFRSPGFGQASRPHVKSIKHWLADIRQRYELPACGLRKAGHVEQCELGDTRLNRGDTRHLRELIDQRPWRALCLRENIREAVSLIISDACFLKRAMRPDREHQRRHAAADNQGNGKDPRPEAPDITEQLDIERGHGFTSSTAPLRGGFRSAGAWRYGRRRIIAPDPRPPGCWHCG